MADWVTAIATAAAVLGGILLWAARKTLACWRRYAWPLICQVRAPATPTGGPAQCPH